MGTNGSDLVGFDAERATEATRELADGTLLVTAVYTPSDYAILPVSDQFGEMYADDHVEMDLDDAGELAQQYSQIDFVERATFPDMYPTLESTHSRRSPTSRPSSGSSVTTKRSTSPSRPAPRSPPSSTNSGRSSGRTQRVTD